MKNIKRIIAFTLTFALMTTVLCFTAFASNETEDKYADLRVSIDAKCFTSGSRGSAESTGIIGDSKINGRANMFYPERIDDSVEWTLKDGVLIIDGNGKMAGGDFCYDRYTEPFAKNEHIRTVIVGANVKCDRSIINTLPNLETVIILNNTSVTGAFVINSPNVKTVITGADMTNTPFDTSEFSVDEYLNAIVSEQRTNKFKRTDVTYVGAETSIAITSQVGNIDTLAAQAKAALADACMTDEAWAMLPKALGGTADEVKVDPLKGITVSNWAKDIVIEAIDANIVPKASLGIDYTKAITRAQFCAIATQLYETVTGKTLTASGSFDDTNDTNVLKMASIGVINGYGNGKFGPDDKLTRAQAATILTRLSETLGKNMPEGNPQFTDIAANHWARTFVNKCYKAGIMLGTSDTTFSPNASYTIEQSIVTMVRTMEYATK